MSAATTLAPLGILRRFPREEAASFFARDRLLCAYAIADLDRANVAAARWWVAHRAGVPVAAALVVLDLGIRPLFLYGEPRGVALLLRQGVSDTRVVIGAPPELSAVVTAAYRMERIEPMLRMVVNRRSFRPADHARCVRLGPAHLDAVIELYGLASRTYFTPAKLQREIYFGFYDGPLLAAAAGTHVRSREFGLAAVGNVLTRMSYRNRGLARACTSAVTAACLEEGTDVVLNVREDNAAAIAVYEPLGYTVHAQFIEGVALRRPVWERVAQQLFGPGTAEKEEQA